MANGHDLVPFDLTEGQNPPRTPGFVRCEHGHVDLDLTTAKRVGDYPSRHLTWCFAKGIGARLRQRPVPADHLEVRSGHLGQKGGLSVTPGSSGVSSFQPGPFSAHDGLVEDDERLGDPVPRSALAEGIHLPGYQLRVLQDAERVPDIGGFAADETGDSAACGVPGRDRAEDGMVDGRIADVGFLGQQVPRLPEQGELRLTCPFMVELYT